MLVKRFLQDLKKNNFSFRDEYKKNIHSNTLCALRWIMNLDESTLVDELTIFPQLDS